jgi:hypothetical protein
VIKKRRKKNIEKLYEKPGKQRKENLFDEGMKIDEGNC